MKHYVLTCGAKAIAVRRRKDLFQNRSLQSLVAIMSRNSALSLMLALLVQASPAADNHIVQRGMAVGTCFSGDNKGFQGKPRIISDPTFKINDAPVLAVFDIRDQTAAPKNYKSWKLLPYHDARWTAKTMGQVFGIEIGRAHV